MHAKHVYMCSESAKILLFTHHSWLLIPHGFAGGVYCAYVCSRAWSPADCKNTVAVWCQKTSAGQMGKYSHGGVNVLRWVAIIEYILQLFRNMHLTACIVHITSWCCLHIVQDGKTALMCAKTQEIKKLLNK